MTPDPGYPATGNDRSAFGRLPSALIVIGLLVGLVIGAIAGAAIGAGKAPSYRAVTVASILPDDAVTSTQLGNLGSTSQDATDFIQSELIVLNGRPLRDAVQKQLKLTTAPSLSSSQIGQTYVVNIAASDGSRARAVQIANTARSLYTAQRQQQLSSDVARALTAVQTQTAAVRAGITAEPSAGTTTTGNDALQQEYARLLSVSSSLELASGQVSRAVTTIQPASVESSGLTATKKYALAGAILGLLVAVALLIAGRRAFPRIRTADDLDGFGVRVLRPEFPRVGRGPARRRRTAARGSAQLLASRLSASYDTGTEPIVLIGVRPQAGTTFVATALARALAASSPVLLITSSEDVGALASKLGANAELVDAESVHNGRIGRSGTALGARGSRAGIRVLAASHGELLELADDGLFDAVPRGNWKLIVDAVPLSRSDEGAQLAARVGAATVVVPQARSNPTEVLSAIEILEARGVPRVSVLLNHAPRLRSRARTRPAPAPAPQELPAVVSSEASVPQVARLRGSSRR